jgi:hypothetical protein
MRNKDPTKWTRMLVKGKPFPLLIKFRGSHSSLSIYRNQCSYYGLDTAILHCQYSGITLSIGNGLPFTSIRVHLVGSLFLIFLVFLCGVLLYVFTFRVPSCDAHYDFCIKQCLVHIYLQVFVFKCLNYVICGFGYSHSCTLVGIMENHMGLGAAILHCQYAEISINYMGNEEWLHPKPI